MADAAPVVHIGENSPEQVAWKLLGAVAYAEDKQVYHASSGDNPCDRAYILDTYAECLHAVRGYRSLPKS